MEAEVTISDNNIQQQQPPQDPSKTIEEFIAVHQEQWTTIVNDLSTKMKSIPDLIELQNLIYAKRQDALDYYFSLLGIISRMSKDYKQKYAQQYNAYKVSSQIRYNSDSAINAQIAANLADLIYQNELLDSHAKYMQETIKTIDSIIFAINNRIKIEDLINGVKR